MRHFDGQPAPANAATTERVGTTQAIHFKASELPLAEHALHEPRWPEPTAAPVRNVALSRGGVRARDAAPWGA